MERDENKINNLVETILERYSPKLGVSLGYSYPLKDSKEDYVWEIERLYELDEEELKDILRKLEQLNEKSN